MMLPLNLAWMLFAQRLLSVSRSAGTDSPVLPLNVTVAIYMIAKRPFLQSLPFAGPGFNLAVRDVNRMFQNTLNVRHTFITAANSTNCADFTANYDLMTRYYYKERTLNDGLMALVFAGKAELHPLYFRNNKV